MHQTDRIQQIADDEGSALLRQRLASRDNVVELPVAAEFKHRVKVVLICEVAISLGDVGMVQEALDLELSDELHQ